MCFYIALRLFFTCLSSSAIWIFYLVLLGPGTSVPLATAQREVLLVQVTPPSSFATPTILNHSSSSHPRATPGKALPHDTQLNYA